MKYIFLTVLLLINGFAIAAFSQDQKIESLRTVLAEKTCASDETANTGNGILGMEVCEGAIGYKVAITYLEHGQWLKLISPDGKEVDLELFESMGVESYIGDEIEWRIERDGDSANLTAIIFPREVIRRGFSDEKPLSKIAVFKITGNTACLIADLKAVELTKAREFADNPAKHPCYSESDIEPDDLSDTHLNFDLPEEAKLEDAEKRRFTYFHDEKSKWATLVLERLFPIGWSKDGKFAYLVEPADIACDCYYASLIVKDIPTNKTIWKFDHEEPLDPSDKSYETGDTQEYRSAFWKNNQKSLSEKLKNYGIVPIENAQLLKFPVKYKKDEINVRIEISRDEESEYDYPQNLSKIEVKAKSNNSNSKTIFEEKFDTDNTFSYVEDADVFGYFQSPFEPLAAFVIVRVERGQHGMSPNPTVIQILGFDLVKGFDDID